MSTINLHFTNVSFNLNFQQNSYNNKISFEANARTSTNPLFIFTSDPGPCLLKLYQKVSVNFRRKKFALGKNEQRALATFSLGIVIMHLLKILLLILKCFEVEFVLVFTRNVSTHCIIACECSRTERTRHTYALMPLTDVSS